MKTLSKAATTIHVRLNWPLAGAVALISIGSIALMVLVVLLAMTISSTLAEAQALRMPNGMVQVVTEPQLPLSIHQQTAERRCTTLLLLYEAHRFVDADAERKHEHQTEKYL